MSIPILCKQLCKRYGEVEALRGLDLEVGPGEIFGLLGPNGAGKTTTTKILLTLVAPTSGEAYVGGLSVTSHGPQVRRLVGYVPQELTSDPYLTGRENLDFFGRIYHVADRSKRVGELLDRMGLTAAADRLVKTYSGGMRKRLDIAVGLLHEPQVVLLDEPSLGLDVEARRAVWDEIRRLREAKVAILLCTNAMDEADALADRLGIIQDGRILKSGSPKELKSGLGGDVISLTARADAAAWEAFRAAVQAIQGVEVASLREGGARLVAKNGERSLAAVVGAASGAGIAIDSLDFARPSLDQVFIHYAGRRMSSAGESGEGDR